MAAGGDQKLCNSLSEFFDGYIEQFADTIPTAANNSDVDNIFFSTLEEVVDPQKSSSSSLQLDQAAMEKMSNISPCRRKRQKLMTDHHPVLVEDHEDGGKQQKLVSHIAVERNRRKQMNQHLTVLRSLMPCFYVKRGDQASIIGGVVDYITELQQVLQSLEAKKQRKVYSDHVLSPRCSPLSPRSKPPLSPRPLLPISPRTPQPLSPYRSPCWLNQPHQLVPNPSNYSLIANMSTASPYSPASSSNSSNTSDIVNELVANSKSNINIADVEVKFCGSNLVLKTVSPRLPGQITKIVSVLEDLSLEIIQAGVNTVDDTMVNSFTIKIGIECRLSVEDLVQHIKQTFC